MRRLAVSNRAIQRTLNAWLDTHGFSSDYDPFLPPLDFSKKLIQHSTHTPGVRYPPGYYTKEAQKAIAFDRWIEYLEKQSRKIVPLQNFS